MPLPEERLSELAGLKIFGDLPAAELREVAHDLDEQGFPAEQRILREGIGGSNFYVILEGEVSVEVGGSTRSRLGRGDFFGEISILLQDVSTADVTAKTEVRCLYLPADKLKDFLVKHPLVMFRILQDEAMRVENANKWQS